jgi:hypothetical protein
VHQMFVNIVATVHFFVARRLRPCLFMNIVATLHFFVARRLRPCLVVMVEIPLWF